MSTGEDGLVTTTALRSVGLGPMTVMAPDLSPRQLGGDHGHAWQWVGDGQPLLTLIVAVGESDLERDAITATPRLEWEIRRVRDGLGGDEEPRVERMPVEVDGATHAASATLDGVREGLAVRHGLVVCTDGDLLRLVQVAVARTPEGMSLVEEIVSQVRIHPWTMPR